MIDCVLLIPRRGGNWWSGWKRQYGTWRINYAVTSWHHEPHVIVGINLVITTKKPNVVEFSQKIAWKYEHLFM
jgi:hypothetical protein